jgi:hypothetical protein
MNKEVLYNGKQFPDYVFKKKGLKFYFFEFNFLFTEDFWKVFKIFLIANDISEIEIVNLQPDFSFNSKIDVISLPDSFMKLACSEVLEGYFSFKASLYMITENAIIYSTDKTDSFCLVLDRKYWLGILGIFNSKSEELLNDLDIKNISDYLKMSFKDEKLPLNFKNALIENWKTNSL